MQKENTEQITSARTQREKESLKRLYLWEDLAEKKARIYARLLTEVSLAKDMEELAERHKERKTTLASMIEEV